MDGESEEEEDGLRMISECRWDERSPENDDESVEHIEAVAYVAERSVSEQFE